MGCANFFRRVTLGLMTASALFLSVPVAFALSSGCAAVNALSGSSSLSFSSNRYPASDFAAGDALTLSFTDSGAAYGGDPTASDSVSIARYNLSSSRPIMPPAPAVARLRSCQLPSPLAAWRQTAWPSGPRHRTVRSAIWYLIAPAHRRPPVTPRFQAFRFPSVPQPAVTAPRSPSAFHQ